MRTLSAALVALAGGLLLPQVADALIINGENAEDNYRFESGYPGTPVPNTSPNFVAAGYDLSGVGWGTNSFQSFTMISDQYFVFATHHPPPNSSIFFYSPADNAVVSYTIDTTFSLALEYPLQAPGNHLKSDLSIGRLTTTIDPADDIAFYPILDLPTSGDYLGQDLLVYGWSAAVGTGVIEGLGGVNLYWDATTPGIASDDVLNTVTNFDALNDTFVMSYTQGAGAGEALLQGGDSGSPSFVVWNGSLALVGVHSAVSGSTNYDVFIPAYLTQLSDEGIPISTVPEPTTLLLLGCAGFVTLAARRGRRGAR